MPHTVADLAKHVRGEVLGDGTAFITGFAPADAAKKGDLTFAETDAYFAAAEASAAAAEGDEFAAMLRSFWSARKG